MLNQKKILHRDVSLANILRKPDHHGAKLDYVGAGAIPFRPIDAILQEDVLNGIKNNDL